MNTKGTRRHAPAQRTRYIICPWVLIIAASCACASVAAQTTSATVPSLSNNQPKPEKVAAKTTDKPAPKTPTTTLTFYGAGVRGGGVQSTIYPAGGANPTARFFYAELIRRF